MNIVLCGMMGSGKTTVAGVLSKAYNFKAVDTDALIVERYGNIDAIFEKHGEEYFRRIESSVTAELARTNINAVISLGGGCVLKQINVENLKATGKIVYLETSAETVIKRLKGDKTRPLLKGCLEERVNKILSERAAIYESVADLKVVTDGKTPDEIAKEIIEKTGITAK